MINVLRGQLGSRHRFAWKYEDFAYFKYYISKTFCPILMKLSGILEQGRTFVMVKLILHKFAY